jgi:hypothetical protein
MHENQQVKNKKDTTRGKPKKKRKCRQSCQVNERPTVLDEFPTLKEKLKNV